MIDGVCYKKCTPSKQRSIRMAEAEKETHQGTNEHSFGEARRSGVRCHMDVVTLAVVGVILVSYLVGSLTSSVETEQKLPHRY